MARTAIVLGKTVTLVTITWGVASWIAPDAVPAAHIGRIVGIALPAAHLLELPFYRGLIREVGGSPAMHAAQVLAFGILHKLDMEHTLRARQQS